MKIGFVGNLYGTPKGHSYVVKTMVETLMGDGHETHMYRIWNNELLPEFPMPTTLETEASQIIPEDKFRKWLNEIKPDWCIFVEYKQWWEENHDKVAICKDLGIKTIGFNMYEKLDWTKLDHYKLYTKMIGPTRFQTKLMRKHGLYQTCHIPWGIDLKEIDAIIEPVREPEMKDKIVFYHCAGSGGVGERKNSKAIIDAYNLIKDKNTELMITHLKSKVFGRNEILSFTKYADILVNTSRWDTLGLNCQPKGSKIYTTYGIKNIEDIDIGDNVLTHKNKFEKVINIFNGKNKLHTIKCDYTSDLKLTGEHPILTIQTTKSKYRSKKILMKPKWVKAEEITPYDFLAVPKPKYIKQCNSLKIMDYVDNKNIIKRDGYIYNKYSQNMKKIKVSMYDLMKKYDINKNTVWRIINNVNTEQTIQLEKKIRKEYNNFNIKIPDKVIVDKDFCRLLGFFVAEGWTEKDSCFGFAFHTKEKDYHKFVLKTMKKKFNLDGKMCVRGNGTSILFFNSLVNNFFEKLCNKYAHNKNVPIFLLHLNPNLQKEFIKGYFYGDGCIQKNNVTAVTVSKKLAYNIKYLLLRLGILSKITKYPGRKNVKIAEYICNTRDFYIIRMAYSDKMCNLFELEFHKPRYKFYLEDKNNFYVNVRKNTKEKNNTKVYNITVNKDNSYCGEIVLHNSLEAGACSRPVIVSDTEPMNELILDKMNGLTVSGENKSVECVTCPSFEVDIEDLAKRMTICKNKEILKTLKRNARVFAEKNFDWNKNKKHFLGMFKV